MRKVWSRDLGLVRGGDRALPAWMIELAEQVGMIEREVLAAGALLPTGVIVGSAVIEKVSRADDPSTSSGQAHSTSSRQAMYRWHLADVRHAKTRRKPSGHPQPVWFTPF